MKVVRPHSVSFTIPEMYSLVRGNASTWGLEGYRVPALPFDATKKKFNDDMFLIHVGKKKRPKAPKLDAKAIAQIKKGGIFDQLEK